MSFDLTALRQFSLGGKSYVHQETLAADAMEALEASIPIAWAGTLTTRTDDDTGTITMTSASHLITTGAKVDIYWTGGQRRNVTVGTVAGTSVPFGAGVDIGAGTVLPVATTAVIVAVKQTFNVSITGDDVLSLLATADSTRCQIVLNSAGPVEELAIHLNSGEAYDWLSTSTVANPIAGDVITLIDVTIADTVTARNVRIAAQIDA